MVADLSQLIDAHNRGEDTDERFAEFMDKHGQFFPERPADLVEELIDSLARRAAAQERMMDGLSAEQRAELADLMAQRAWPTSGWPARWPTCRTRCAGPAGPAAGAAREQDARRRAGRSAWATRPAPSPELADLEALYASSPRATPGASLDDIDEELLERALGRPAVDDLEALRQLERELRAAGLPQPVRRARWSSPPGGPAAGRDRAAPGLRRCSSPTGRGHHDVRDAGAAGRADRRSRGAGSSATSSRSTSSGRCRNAVLRAPRRRS